MYVAVKGGEAAIDNAHQLLAHARRGDSGVPEIGTDQIAGQLSLEGTARIASFVDDPETYATLVKIAGARPIRQAPVRTERERDVAAALPRSMSAWRSRAYPLLSAPAPRRRLRVTH